MRTQCDAITGHWASAVEEHLNELNYKRIIGFEVKCIFNDCNCNENEILLDDFHNCFDFGNVFALSWARKADYDKKDEKIAQKTRAVGGASTNAIARTRQLLIYTHTHIHIRHTSRVVCARERERERVRSQLTAACGMPQTERRVVRQGYRGRRSFLVGKLTSIDHI